MRIFYNKVFKNYLLLVVTLFIIEIIFRACVGLPILSMNILRIFVGINLISLLVSLLTSFLGRLASNVICGIVAGLSTVYVIIQVGFYKYLGAFVSYSNFNQLDAVKDYIGEYIGSIPFSGWLICIPTILLILYYIFVDYKLTLLERNDTIDFADKFDSEERKKLNDEKFSKLGKRRNINSKINGLVFSIVFLGIYIFLNSASFMQSSLQIKSAKELINNPDMPNLAVNNLGNLMYSVVDIKASLLHSSVKEIGTEFDSGYKKQEQVISDYTRNVDDTLWLQVADNEGNTKYGKINNYLLSQEITDKNDYTGFLKGKNLILIEMSSVNNMIINKEFFPNIYKLYNEGWSWDNAYSPSNICAGGNNEISALTGLYMLNNDCVANSYKNNIYTDSIFNLFNNAGYETTSFHNYTNQYYNRSVVHPNMGSNYYGVEELGIPYNNAYTEWPSDVALMEKVLEITKNQNKFMTFVTTASTLHPYDSSSELGDKYLDLFEDTNYNISLKRYMSKLKELDNAIGILIQGLEDQGKLDNTVIVLYSDHAPYGLTNEELNSYFDYDVSINSEKDRTPFIIYNSKMEADKHNEYTSYVNITPTIANLFDLDYDPRVYLGKDVLANNYENRLIMSDGSWQDERAYYNASINKLTYYKPNNDYSSDELNKINNDVRNKIVISNLIVRSNYFNYLSSAKDEYRVAQVETQNNE